MDNMQYQFIFPAVILYAFVCEFIVHLIADRHNRAKRRSTYIGKHRVRNTK